jgi:hypothetical protein
MGPHERKLRSEMLRRGGRAVEGTSLENWQRRKAFVGSNPTLSATFIARNQANKPSNFPGPVTRPAAVRQLRARGVSPIASEVHHIGGSISGDLHQRVGQLRTRTARDRQAVKARVYP